MLLVLQRSKFVNDRRPADAVQYTETAVRTDLKYVLSSVNVTTAEFYQCPRPSRKLKVQP